MTQPQLCSLEFSCLTPQLVNDDDRKVALVMHMFTAFDLLECAGICQAQFLRFLQHVCRSYNCVQFHNFSHAFCVTQMMYVVLHHLHLHETAYVVPNEDKFLLLLACICHDLDHKGVSNSFLVHTNSEMAHRCDNISPLEHHHVEVAAKLITEHRLASFDELPLEGAGEEGSHWSGQRLLERVSRLILATDMGAHVKFVTALRALADSRRFQFTNDEHLMLLYMNLVKLCDISNELRPYEQSKQWVERLYNEFVREKFMRFLSEQKADSATALTSQLPTDTHSSSSPAAVERDQIEFINDKLLPTIHGLCRTLPSLTKLLIGPAQSALDGHKRRLQLLRVGREPTFAASPPVTYLLQSTRLSAAFQQSCSPSDGRTAEQLEENVRSSLDPGSAQNPRVCGRLSRRLRDMEATSREAGAILSGSLDGISGFSRDKYLHLSNADDCYLFD